MTEKILIASRCGIITLNYLQLRFVTAIKDLDDLVTHLSESEFVAKTIMLGLGRVGFPFSYTAKLRARSIRATHSLHLLKVSVSRNCDHKQPLCQTLKSAFPSRSKVPHADSVHPPDTSPQLQFHPAPLEPPFDSK